MRPWICVVVTVLACSGGKEETGDDPPTVDGDADTDTDTDSDADTDTDTDVPCTNDVGAATPSDGAVDVVLATTVSFTLDAADPTAVVTVTDADGAAVSGSTTVDDATVTWTGDALSPSTTYTSEVTHACGTGASTWTTAPSVEGRVWAIALGEGDWVDPPTFGVILGQYFEDVTLLISPTTADATDFELRVATGQGGVQDPCIPTTTAAATSWIEPAFQVEGEALILAVEDDVQLQLAEARLGGTFTADRTRIDPMGIAGNMDTRLLADLVEEGGPPDLVCQLVAALGVRCVPCPDNEPYCLTLRVEALVGREVPGPLVVRTAEDVLADPACP